MLTKCKEWEPLITILGKESEGPQEFQIVKIFFFFHFKNTSPEKTPTL